MANPTLIFLSLLPLFLPFSTAASAVKAGYWFPASEFPVSSINSSLFTHLFCAFASLNSTTNTVTIPPSSSAAFSSFTSTVQKTNPSVSTLLSIGGGSADPKTFSSMASTSGTRKSFIDTSIQLARSNNFFGLDLDWESPASAADMTNLASLFSEWRSAITSESASSGKSPLLLTAAVSFSSSVNGVTFPISSISSNLDWVNVMAYDFYAPKRTHVTSAHAALFDPTGGPSGSQGVTTWLNSGLPGSQIVFGLPYYGYAWSLTNPASHGLGAPSTGLATGTGIDPSDGSIGFNSIKSFIQTNKATTVYNATVVVNYCYAGSTWIGYDDVDSVAAKVAYAKGKGLRGYFAWSVSADNNWALSTKAMSTWG